MIVGSVNVTKPFNHFMAQLIFSFYAEDTSIFQIPGLGLTGECPKNYAGFFTEGTRRKTYKTRQEARHDVIDCIELFYNPKRRHANNGILSPIEYEMATK